MDKVCARCLAKHWAGERTKRQKSSPSYSLCCHNGKVLLDLLPDPPDPLRDLFTGNSPDSHDFRLHIHQYNCALAFASFTANEKDVNSGGRGPWVFKIGYMLYHSSGSLLPPPAQEPRYAQLYFYDPADTLTHRMHRNPNLRSHTMQLLQRILLQTNEYTRIFLNASEILQTTFAPDLTICFVADPFTDERRYNPPSADEVAAIVPGDDMALMRPRDIVLHCRAGGIQHISDLHCSYIPLHYVLLFPYGMSGWTSSLQHHPDAHIHDQPEQNARTNLTQLQFYSFWLHTHQNEFPSIHYGGRLFQQYLCDTWVSTDQSRLRYVESNQSTLHATLYSSLEDAVARADDNVNLNNVGHRVILPSTYIGGPRYMNQCFQDAMAVARYYHGFDLFITFTTNPTWPEITQELFPNQTASDRPDLITRVFNMYKSSLIHDLTKRNIFGDVHGHVHTIEFQKRGLPHMHLLLGLNQEFHPSTPDDVDTMIRATWPDPEREPRLFQIVLRSMVHGPCGRSNPRAPCMKDGQCTKRYPKPFQPQTVMTNEGYPIYARPDDGRAYTVRGILMDNRSIVPYNPYLLHKYDAHINVECVMSLAAAKYITKYTHKGPDCATIEIWQRDEVSEFKDCRYIAASEAAWHLLEFPIHHQYPPVIRLQIHLPGQHLITFDPHEPIAHVQQRAACEKTMLTAFFDANRSIPSARQHTYQEFPQFYVWKKRGKIWTTRQKGFAIGRIYFVSPSAGERFYLRTLLITVKGPTSFQDLRTFNGTIYPTFYDACLAQGLLENDHEWRDCLLEASTMRTGDGLRHLFAVILKHCEPSQPDLLWREFRENLCDDLP